MMVNPRQTRKRNNLVTGCLLPLLGLLVFIAACYGVCLVIYLVGNPNGTSAGSTGIQLLTTLLLG